MTCPICGGRGWVMRMVQLAGFLPLWNAYRCECRGEREGETMTVKWKCFACKKTIEADFPHMKHISREDRAKITAELCTECADDGEQTRAEAGKDWIRTVCCQ